MQFKFVVSAKLFHKQGNKEALKITQEIRERGNKYKGNIASDGKM